MAACRESETAPVVAGRVATAKAAAGAGRRVPALVRQRLEARALSEVRMESEGETSALAPPRAGAGGRGARGASPAFSAPRRNGGGKHGGH